MITNQHGLPIIETQLLPDNPEQLHPDEIVLALAALCQHLKVEVWRTNATPHAYTEIQVRDAP